MLIYKVGSVSEQSWGEIFSKIFQLVFYYLLQFYFTSGINLFFKGYNKIGRLKIFMHNSAFHGIYEVLLLSVSF